MTIRPKAEEVAREIVREWSGVREPLTGRREIAAASRALTETWNAAIRAGSEALKHGQVVDMAGGSTGNAWGTLKACIAEIEALIEPEES